MNVLKWQRVKKGKGFEFVDEKGDIISKDNKRRLKALSIPPAWTDVAISPNPTNHIQAVGFDSKARKQYIYNSKWVKKNQKHKFDQLVNFGERLPSLRQTIRAHMREHALTQDRVIATVIWLLEHTFIRVGNKEYAIENESYGLTTMREKHVEIDGNTVTFNFKGKSGVFHELDITNQAIAKTIRECIELPGYELFQFLGENGDKRVVNSEDVNSYLQSHIGTDFSAKDFRTWGGSVLAADLLYEKGNAVNPFDLKTNISEAVKEVASHLGNTKRVCRTYYIHPVIITSYERDILVPHFERSLGRKISSKLTLSPEEYATWSLIKDF